MLQALLARPKDMTGGPLPGLITGPGFGGWAQGVELSECQRGYVILQVFPRGQGLSEAAIPIARNAKLTAALDHPADHYYRWAYLDLVVALGVLASDPAVDSARIGSVGTSQGGGLALALAALDARIRVVVADLPFLCGLRDCAAIPGSLVYELLDEAGLRSSPNLETLDYFDAVRLAPWIQAPTLLTSGGRDRTCPAETISAVYDRLPGVRCLLHEPSLDHAPSGRFYSATWWWLDWHLRQSAAA